MTVPPMRPIDPRVIPKYQPSRWLAISGFVLLAVGFAWVIRTRILLTASHAADPDIGGGLLLLLAYLAQAAGLVLVVGYEVERRRSRAKSRRGMVWWIGLVIVVALIAEWLVIRITQPIPS